MVDAAAEEIAETGWFSTSTNRIANRAGLSAGVFYNYFSDKIDILLAVYDRWVDDEWVLITKALGDSAVRAPLDQAVDNLVPMLIDHHVRWARMRHALIVLSRSDERVKASRIRSRERQIASIVKILGIRQTAKARSAIAVRLLAFEAVADTIAGGEADALSLDKNTLAAELASTLKSLVPHGDASSSRASRA